MTQARPDELFNLPNALTLSRVPLAIALWFVPRELSYVLPILGAAAVADVLDGWTARRRRRRLGLPLRGGIGGWLDPACDKVFVVSVLALAYVALRPPLAMVLVVATRELVQLPLLAIWGLSRRVRRRFVPDLHARPWGKAATVGQFCAMAAIFLQWEGQWGVAAAAGLLGLAAPLDYLRDSYRRGSPLAAPKT
ncbi:MAG: CDP-alcohol phosphatidyltransferase family protein [Myxococcota bacterium]